MEYRSLHLPDRIAWDDEESTDKRGRIVIKPLERGFGRTLGNALRRVLLSSLEGAAPVSVKIEGASHEFTTIPGVFQDVPDIILNIKSLDLKHEGTGSARLRLDMKGPATARSADLKGDSCVEILDPDQVIAEIGPGSRLKLEITVEKGKGYVTAEEWYDAGRGKEIGEILLDSWFGPVRKVNYSVDPARVGDRTDFDSLTMDIETDGSITPQDALSRACDILVKHFELILGKEPGSEDEQEEVSGDTSLRDTALSPRIVNVLEAGGIETLEDLAAKTPSDLLSLPNLGQASLKLISEFLEQYGMELGED